jgi:hypothetical protein
VGKENTTTFGIVIDDVFNGLNFSANTQLFNTPTEYNKSKFGAYKYTKGIYEQQMSPKSQTVFRDLLQNVYPDIQDEF